MVSGLCFKDSGIGIYVPPKCARTSIYNTLCSAYKLPKETVRDVRHRQKCSRTGLNFSSLFKIGMYRDTFQRIESVYRDKCLTRQRPNARLRDMGFYYKMPFQEFISVLESVPIEQSEKHLRPQYLTINQHGPVDLLLRFEDMVNEWKRVQALFFTRALRKIPDLLHLNSSISKRIKWGDEQVATVQKLYHKDISLFNH